MNNEFMAMPGMPELDVSNAYSGPYSGNSQPAEWFYELMTGGIENSDSGVKVNGYTALTHCPLWQGVNVIAGDLGQVPVKLVKDMFNDQKSHWAWNLLRVRPNELQTPSVWMETMIQWALIWGNGVSWIVYDGSRPTDLIPLRPDCLWPELRAFEGSIFMLYHYTSPYSGQEYVFLPDEVIHIQGLTGDGVWGYPLHEIAKNCIAMGITLEKHGNRSFKNGAMPSGVLQHPGKLPPEARKELRKDWESIHGGVNNSGKVAVLWEGMQFNQTAQRNIDAQWIEAKRLSRQEAASLLNLPAWKLNSMEDSAVRANLEETNETYKQMTLTRWGNRCDQEFRRKLLTDAQWKSDQYQFVFDWDAFLRADIDTLTTVADRCVKAEIMNRNEARKMIRMPPYAGGEKFGSPAINPQDKGPDDKPEPASGEKSESEPPQNRLKAMSDAHEMLLLDHLMVLLKREAISLKQAAKESKNFVQWLDDFYGGEGVENPQVSALCDTVMGSSIRASCAAGLDARGISLALISYAKNRHAQLLSACDGVTKEELPAAIEKLANSERTLIAQGLLATALGRKLISTTENE